MNVVVFRDLKVSLKRKKKDLNFGVKTHGSKAANSKTLTKRAGPRRRHTMSTP